jgi:hypothetical protein
MDRWDELYEQMRAVDVARTERAQRAAADAEERRLFDEWCAQVTGTVMQRIADVATERATALEEHTGKRMRVEYPSRAPIEYTPGGPAMTFMTLDLEGSLLQIYSYRGPGDLPFIHFVPIPRQASPSAGRPKHQRLISVPGAFIARHQDGSWELLRARLSDDDEPAEPTSIDELVYRAFELLVASLSRPVRS